MSKQTSLIVAGVAILIVIIAGIVAFTQLRKSSKTTQQAPVTEQKVKPSETESKGSIKSLLGMGKSVSCSVTFPTDQGVSKGTVYVADKKMRSDFTVKATAGKEMESHMIQDDTWSYFWSSAMLQGTKMKLSDVPKATPTPGSSQNQNVDLDKEVQYKCSSWSVDNSRFIPPSNVQFMDMSQMMNQTQTQTNQMKNSQKSVCDQIVDPTAKAACLNSASGY